MALVKCLECGKELSTDAKACPHCGAPKLSSVGGSATRIGLTRLYGLGLIALGVWIMSFASTYGIIVIIFGIALMVMKINKRE